MTYSTIPHDCRLQYKTALTPSPATLNPPALFTSNRGFLVVTRTLRWLMKKYAVKANLPKTKCHFHVLKHSIGTHMIGVGAEVVLVKDWLGHKNIQNTLIYAQLIGKTRDELASKVFASRKVV